MKILDIIPPPPHKLIDNDEWVIDNRNTYTKYHVNKSIIKNRDESYQFLITSQYSRKIIYNSISFIKRIECTKMRWGSCNRPVPTSLTKSFASSAFIAVCFLLQPLRTHISQRLR